MQLLRFLGPEPQIAAVKGKLVVDLRTAAFRHLAKDGRSDFMNPLVEAAMSNPKALMASWPSLSAFFATSVDYDDGAAVLSDDVGSLRLLPFVSNPEKVIALGYNYRALCEDRGVPIPEEPFIFSKLPSSIIGPRDDVIVPHGIRLVDFEAELAVIIGKSGRNLSESEAQGHIAGYTVINDLTAKAFPRPAKPGREPALPQNKGPDGFGPLGDIVMTADEVVDIESATIVCVVNGEERQRFPVGDWVHSAAACISYASQTMTLRSGDIFAMGTSLGMGDHDVPPRLLEDGDTVECRLTDVATSQSRLGDVATARNRLRYQVQD